MMILILYIHERKVKCNSQQKIQQLTTLTFLNVVKKEKAAYCFNVSEYVIQKACKFKEEQGILTFPPAKSLHRTLTISY